MPDWLKTVGTWAGIVGIVLSLVSYCSHVPLDDTDSPTKASGLTLYTDYGTGCQYVGRNKSAVTPRLGTDGKPICRPELINKRQP